MKTRKPIMLWAVDPFASDWKCQTAAAHAIHALTRNRAIEIQPAYVTTNPLPNLPGGFAIELFEGAREKGQDRLDDMLKGIELPRVLPLKILQVSSNSTREQVASLLAYAHELGVESIVVGTRARKGIPRWLFGSFAETLSLQSDIPLIAVNPSWVSTGEQAPREILFPTDFSDASHQVFLKVIRLAKETRYPLRLFHKYFGVAEPVWNSPLESKLSYQNIYDDGLRNAQENMQNWENEARRQEIDVTSKIDVNPGDSVADAIVEQAGATPSLIAMAGESSALEVHSLGSVTRKVLRAATCPVWVLHVK